MMILFVLFEEDEEGNTWNDKEEAKVVMLTTTTMNTQHQKCWLESEIARRVATVVNTVIWLDVG